MKTLESRLQVLESLSAKDEVVGLEVCRYEDWPDPVPPDWRETSAGSGFWLTPVEVTHEKS